eukprot:3610399-Amphidinium_carterae.1
MLLHREKYWTSGVGFMCQVVAAAASLSCDTWPGYGIRSTASPSPDRKDTNSCKRERLRLLSPQVNL